jgi:hypothetical protein
VRGGKRGRVLNTIVFVGVLAFPRIIISSAELASAKRRRSRARAAPARHYPYGSRKMLKFAA